MVQNKKLERTANLLGMALNRSSGSLKVVENGIFISKPMKQNGTTNIAVMYELTDGQTVSVMLHNPDTTPMKITPDDMLTSWKWLLNRKDITIIVARENGKDLPLQQVARRVMALVEKNTARFAKANATRAARINGLAAMEKEIAEKEGILADLVKQIEDKANGVSGEKEAEPANIDTEDAPQNDVQAGDTPSEAEDEQAPQQAAETEADTAPVVVAGKELGDFDTDTEEGKKALREAAFNYLKGLAESGDSVYCAALSADVGFTVSGAKKYKQTSASPIKSILAAKIKEIIAKGIKFKESRESYDVQEQADGLVYHYLKTAVEVDGNNYGVRVVIRETDGKYHYDLQVKDSIDSIMDGLDIESGKPVGVNESPVSCRNQGISSLEKNAMPFLDGGQAVNSAVMDGVMRLIPEYEGNTENKSGGQHSGSSRIENNNMPFSEGSQAAVDSIDAIMDGLDIENDGRVEVHKAPFSRHLQADEPLDSNLTLGSEDLQDDFEEYSKEYAADESQQALFDDTKAAEAELERTRDAGKQQGHQ